MKEKLQNRLDELLKETGIKIDENNLDVYEQVIHDRGVSSGYFNIFIEDISYMDNYDQMDYIQGQLHGIANYEKLSDEQKEARHYDVSRHSYLTTLGTWFGRGELVHLNLDSLNEEELKYFNKGIEVAKEEALKKEEVSNSKVRIRK